MPAQHTQHHRDTGTTWAEYCSLSMLLALLAGTALLYFDRDLLEPLRYHRAALFDEPWRLLSHAFVHINQFQLTANLSVLACLYFLFGKAFASLWWVLALLASALAVALGLYYYSPNLTWIAGLWGALHGLFLYAVLRSRASALWLLALAAKLVLEQSGVGALVAPLFGWVPDSWAFFSTAALLDNPAAINANLWGSAGGLFFYFLVRGTATMLVFLDVARAR